MGLFGGMKDAKDALKAAPDMIKQAGEMQQQAAGMQAAGGMPAMGDMAGAMAMQQKLTKINASGVNKQATVQAMTPTGNVDPGGGTEYAITVQVHADDPGSGAGYTATFNQNLVPVQMEALKVGEQITVRIDPEDMNSMLFWGGAA